MDLAATLGFLFAIGSGLGLLYTALNSFLGRDPGSPLTPTAPLRPGSGPARPRGRHLANNLTLAVAVLVFGAQYEVAPATSILTYPFVPGVPFPGSTLNACQVTVADFPQGNPVAAQPYFSESLAGQTLRISGSSVLYGLFTQAGGNFDLINATTTTVDRLDSTQGLQDVIAGRAQIGLSDIYVQDDPDSTVQSARGLVDYQVAVAPFTLLVSRDLKDVVRNLTTQQIIDIYSHKITNWRSIGGPDEPITAFNRKEGSGTRVNFEKYVLGISVPSDDLRARTTQGLISLIARTRGAIGYAATTSLIHANNATVYPVCIDGYGATMDNINSGRYAFWSYEHAYIKNQTPLTSAFMAYVCGAAFQHQEVVGDGFLQPSLLKSDAVITHLDDYPQPQHCG